MSEPFTDEELYYLGGIIHEAWMKDCWGNHRSAQRQEWPKTFKDWRQARHHGQLYIDRTVLILRSLHRFMDMENVKLYVERMNAPKFPITDDDIPF